MNSGVLWSLVVLGVFVCIALIVKIKKQVRFIDQHKQELSDLNAKVTANQKKLRESICILCSSMIDEQVEISEGCMRVKILLDHLDARYHHDAVISVFNEVYDRLEKMPRFEQRKTVNKRILNKLDETRFAVEDEYRERALVACKILLGKLGPIS